MSNDAFGSSYQNGPDSVGPSSSSNQQPLPGGTKIKEIQNEVDQLATVMQSNINKVIERGDRMDTLTERSELLTSRANEFRINSRNVRRKYWWENFRFQLIIGTAALAIVILIIYSLSR